MEDIKIFIASSLHELHNERIELIAFISQLGKLLKQHFSSIDPVCWEWIDPSYSDIGKQNEINIALSSCNIALFMFYKDAGDHTIQEFDVAKKEFSKKGFPVIYSFLKTSDRNSMTDKLKGFIDSIEKPGSHYLEHFDNIDTIKLHITIALQSRINKEAFITADNERILVGNEPIIEIQNIAEISHSAVILDLRKEFEHADADYIRKKTEFEKSGLDENAFLKAKIRREYCLSRLNEAQSTILGMIIDVSSDAIHGEISARQKNAYGYIEEGKYNEAISCLQNDEIVTDFRATEMELEQLASKNAIKFINEQVMAIKTYRLLINDASRFDKIAERYESIVPAVLKYRVKLLSLYYYGVFLFEQRQYRKSMEILALLTEHLSECQEATEVHKAKINNLLGSLYMQLYEYDKANTCYTFVYDLGMNMYCDVNFLRASSSGLARVSNNLSVLNILSGHITESKGYILQSIGYFESLLKFDEAYKFDLACSKVNYAYILILDGDITEALKLMGDASESCAEVWDVIDKYSIYICLSRINCAKAIIAQLEGNWEKSEMCLLKALEKTSLASAVYPMKYDLLNAVIHSGIAYANTQLGKSEKANKHYAEAKQLLTELIKHSPEIYEKDLSMLNYIKEGTIKTWYDSSLVARGILTMSL